MHKILILGHSSSKFHKVAELLHSFGMQEAQPSRREGFSPAEITRIICQAHGVGENSISELEPEINQLEVGNIWHGMALDLMLGNLDSKIWGWADTKSIYLLNYWRDLDPEITFVLVYSNPEDVLLNDMQSDNLTAGDLESKIQHWIAYNEALLHFYNRNKGRCFLVHSQQVDVSSHRYLLEMGAKINAPWLEQVSNEQLESEQQSQNVARIQGGHDHQVDYALQSEYGALAVTEFAHVMSPYESGVKEKPLSLFISKLIIQQHPKLIQLYEDLQSFANFPLSASTAGSQQQSFNQSAFDAWLEMTGYLNQLKQTEEESIAIAQKNAELMSELVKLEEIPKLEHENSHVITQLHQVQEQLEKLHIDNMKLKESEAGHESKLKELNETQLQLQKMQGELKKLDALPNLEQENSMLLQQLHQVQEELERYYLENQAYKEAVNTNPQDLEYTAEQIKRQLTFRLGKVMIEKHQSIIGMLFIGVALLKEARACKLEARKSPQQKKKLSTYERHQVESIKKYLDYRLGFIFLDSLKNPFKWFTLPFKFWHEIKPYLQKKH